MSNHKLPAKLIPYSIVLWYVRKYQLQQTSKQLQQMKALLLSFEIRYQDICGIQPIQNTNVNRQTHRNNFESIGIQKSAFFIQIIPQKSDKRDMMT